MTYVDNQCIELLNSYILCTRKYVVRAYFSYLLCAVLGCSALMEK